MRLFVYRLHRFKVSYQHLSITQKNNNLDFLLIPKALFVMISSSLINKRTY